MVNHDFHKKTELALLIGQRMQRLYTLILFLLLTTIGCTQALASPIDTLMKQVRALERRPGSRDRDTALACVLDSCARYWIMSGQPTKATKPLRRFEALCQQYVWPWGEALLLYRKGQYEGALGNTTQAKAYFLQAIPRLKQVSNIHTMLLAYVQMGVADIDRDWADTTGMRNVIRYLREGIAISVKHPNRWSYASLNFRLSRAYMQLNDYSQALFYLNESWQESQHNGYIEMPFANCLHFAVCYTHLNDEARRQSMWKQCQSFLPKLTVQERYQYYWFSADMHRYRKEYARMVADGQQYLRYAHVYGSPSKRLQAHRILFDAYKHLNQPADALAQLEAINQLEDSTRLQRSTVQLAELQLRYDTRLQQEKLDQLTIEKQQIEEQLLVGGLVVLGLLMAFVLFTNYRLRQKNRAISAAHLQGQTLERQRVAADLHDNLGTTLSSLQWTLSALNKQNLTTDERNLYQTLTQRLDQAYNDVRLLAHNLMPIQLAKTGLAGALHAFVEQINRNNAVRFVLTLPPDLPRFEARTEFEVYSICLELCTNILKHAQASEARITLILSDNQLNLTVTDNGVGLTDKMSEGRGLQNIRARAEGLGGTWQISSEPGQGVTHQIAVPVRTLARAETHI